MFIKVVHSYMNYDLRNIWYYYYLKARNLFLLMSEQCNNYWLWFRWAIYLGLNVLNNFHFYFLMDKYPIMILNIKHTNIHTMLVSYFIWKINTTLNFSCSICEMKQNHHFIVPKEKFMLLEGGNDGQLTTYSFNTHKAKHTFCSKCGVQSFYTPRSNLDGFGN